MNKLITFLLTAAITLAMAAAPAFAGKPKLPKRPGVGVTRWQY
jgi:hypothetical protein